MCCRAVACRLFFEQREALDGPDQHRWGVDRLYSDVERAGGVAHLGGFCQQHQSDREDDSTFTIRRGTLPAGLTGEAAAAAKAWMVYWEYLAVADSIAFIDPATSGSVMTGAAAAKASAYAARLKRTKTHVIGTVGVDMTSALVHGSTATLCGRLQMNAFEVDAAGSPVESTLPTVMFFKGTAVKAGPKWRISDYVNLRSPC